MNQQQQIMFTSESQREQYIFKVVERAFDNMNIYDFSKIIAYSDRLVLKNNLLIEEIPKLLQYVA